MHNRLKSVVKFSYFVHSRLTRGYIERAERGQDEPSSPQMRHISLHFSCTKVKMYISKTNECTVELGFSKHWQPGSHYFQIKKK